MESFERSRILQKAEGYLGAEAVTVTAQTCERSAGGKHDFYSEGDYWWPNPEDPDGAYIRRDGETNPDNFVAHRHAMVRLSDIVATQASAYLLTGEPRYVTDLSRHLRAWFVDTDTRMNPELLYGQAIKGKVTGRSIGVIDTIHLVEVARAVEALEGRGAIDAGLLSETKAWFAAYLKWLNEHPYGQQEKVHPNNHGVCWSLQAAAFARLVGDAETLAWIRKQFQEVYLEEMMNAEGGFPAELARTKPYGYSLFVIDAMAGVASLASDAETDLWRAVSPSGRSMELGVAYITPYVQDKSSWPLAPDVLYWEEWPVRQSYLFLGGAALQREDLIDLGNNLPTDPTVFETLRNLPIRHPMLWL